MTREQQLAARAVLGLKIVELAQAAGVSKWVVENYEGGLTAPRPKSLVLIRQAFEKKGIRFVNRPSKGEVGILWSDASGLSGGG